MQGSFVDICVHVHMYGCEVEVKRALVASGNESWLVASGNESWMSVASGNESWMSESRMIELCMNASCMNA